MLKSNHRQSHYNKCIKQQAFQSTNVLFRGGQGIDNQYYKFPDPRECRISLMQQTQLKTFHNVIM